MKESRLKRLDRFLKLASNSNLKKINPSHETVLKLAGKFEGQCKIYSIEEESDDEVFEESNLDYYKILDDTEALFKSVNIRISRNEEFYEACISEDGEVMGASVLSKENHGKEMPKLRFSVAVSPKAQGGGIGRKLVKSIIENNKNEWAIEAWVVNPNMAALLETLGFENQGGGEWSRENPFMELPASGSLNWIS